jgi:hypothetical protein
MTLPTYIDFGALKVMAVASVLGSLAGQVIDGAALPFFNVGVSTLGMATAGSMLAFAYGTPVKTRRKLYGYAFGGIFIGVWLVQILPVWLAWHWYNAELMQAPMAGLIALLSRWIVPFVIEEVPVILRRITGRNSEGPGA